VSRSTQGVAALATTVGMPMKKTPSQASWPMKRMPRNTALASPLSKAPTPAMAATASANARLVYQFGARNTNFESPARLLWDAVIGSSYPPDAVKPVHFRLPSGNRTNGRNRT